MPRGGRLPILLSNVPWVEGEEDAIARVAECLGVATSEVLALRLVKKSLDARRKQPTWRAAYRVEVRDEEALLARGVPRLGVGRYAMRAAMASQTVRRSASSAGPANTGPLSSALGRLGCLPRSF